MDILKEKIYTSPLRKWTRIFRINRLVKGLNSEDTVIKFISDNVRNDDVFWDIGAKIGMYSVIAGKVKKVIAIEPEEECFRRLVSNVASIPNIECVKIALGDQNKKMKLKVSEGGKGRHTLLYDGGNYEIVDVRKGEELDLPAPDVVKIDVEGYEEHVLKGMRKHLEKGCRIVVIEIHFGLLDGKAPNRILDFLKSLDFKVKWLGYSHIAGVKGNGL